MQSTYCHANQRYVTTDQTNNKMHKARSTSIQSGNKNVAISLTHHDKHTFTNNKHMFTFRSLYQAKMRHVNQTNSKAVCRL